MSLEELNNKIKKLEKENKLLKKEINILNRDTKYKDNLIYCFFNTDYYSNIKNFKNDEDYYDYECKIKEKIEEYFNEWLIYLNIDTNTNFEIFKVDFEDNEDYKFFNNIKNKFCNDCLDIVFNFNILNDILETDNEIDKFINKFDDNGIDICNNYYYRKNNKKNYNSYDLQDFNNEIRYEIIDYLLSHIKLKNVFNHKLIKHLEKIFLNYIILKYMLINFEFCDDVEPNLYSYAINYVEEKYPEEKYPDDKYNELKDFILDKYLIYSLKYDKDIIKLFNDNLINDIFILIDKQNLYKEIINDYNNNSSLIFKDKRFLNLIDNHIQNNIDCFLSNKKSKNIIINSNIYNDLLIYINDIDKNNKNKINNKKKKMKKIIDDEDENERPNIKPSNIWII